VIRLSLGLLMSATTSRSGGRQVFGEEGHLWDTPLLKVPPASRGEPRICSVPPACRGNLKEGVFNRLRFCRVCFGDWYYPPLPQGRRGGTVGRTAVRPYTPLPSCGRGAGGEGRHNPTLHHHARCLQCLPKQVCRVARGVFHRVPTDEDLLAAEWERSVHDDLVAGAGAGRADARVRRAAFHCARAVHQLYIICGRLQAQLGGFTDLRAGLAYRRTAFRSAQSALICAW
jgi:hypothetical protein